MEDDVVENMSVEFWNGLAQLYPDSAGYPPENSEEADLLGSMLLTCQFYNENRNLYRDISVNMMKAMFVQLNALASKKISKNVVRDYTQTISGEQYLSADAY